MTVRLYYDAPHLLSFDAAVTGRMTLDGRPAVVLDRTAFYPTSGGQPHDTGTLGGAVVLDVRETEAGEIVHLLDRELAGDRVAGQIDADRRRDHREHHTGQHLLSQAFLRVVGAKTIGFHLGPNGVDIDLEAGELSDAALGEVESLSNRVVRDNRFVRIHYARNQEERAGFALRSEPGREGDLRIIEIEEFDATPCGGTHCLATGEIGLIKLRKWEKVGSRARVHFLCGGRAMGDYASKNRLVVDLARTFTIEEAALAETISRQSEELTRLRREKRILRREAAQRDCEQLLAAAPSQGDVRVVVARRDGFSGDELAYLGGLLKRGPRVVAVLATDDAGTARLALAQSADLALDLRPALSAGLAAIQGKGGGRPDALQGAGPDCSGLETALAEAARVVRESLNR